jgi:hypothetical protein
VPPLSAARLVPRDSSRDALRRAYEARRSLLDDKRRDATRALSQELLGKARALLKEAEANRDAIKKHALQSSDARTPELIDAEERVSFLTEEIKFASERLRQADNEMAIARSETEQTAVLIRDAARAVIAEGIAAYAARLNDRIKEVEDDRAVLRGAVIFAEGLGLLLDHATHQVDLRPPPDMTTRNMPLEVAARSSAAAWRSAFAALQEDPDAPLPTEEE